ncbi:hypothetical protein BGZ61DRAFT_116067 [Ilyonectria robusta]|uniref:uncharacterized protein n=1 Tax=Ilyonectria robusta TaxID=1079257 RepID=UPI001E8D95DC|nr:uncharacterized protein BGZ61DRAFT_116067 [Ilyonectria robusta]KAH8669287.1 hypothetical protein BGZ61DRAFT_116067 [Ilyonectria robusta]
MYCRTTLAAPKAVDLAEQKPFQPEKYDQGAPRKRRHGPDPKFTVKPKKKPKGTIDVKNVENVENVATTLRKKGVKGLKSLDRRELIAAAPLQVVKGGIKVGDVSLKSFEDMFTFADGLGMPEPPNNWTPSSIGPLQWTLRIIASCLRIVQRETELVQHLDASEEAKRVRWEKCVLVLNRMVSYLGPIGLRLYDAYAENNYMLTACIRNNINVETREAIADRAAKLLHHEVAAAWRGNVRVFCLPYAIEMILESKAYEDLRDA